MVVDQVEQEADLDQSKNLKSIRIDMELRQVKPLHQDKQGAE